MGEPEPHAEPQAAKARRGKGPTRVDAAHRMSQAAAGEVVPMPVAASDARAADVAAEASRAAETIQQVRAQATQLATHLQRQQATVDHREAELNARLAAMENEIRSARLWLNERHEELAARTAQLDERQRALDEREAVLSAASGGRVPRKAKPVASTAVDARLAELDRRQAELDALSARLSERFSTVEHARDFEHAMRALEARNERLQQAEKLLAEDRAQLEVQHQQLGQQRAQQAETAQSEWGRLAQQQQQFAAEQAQAQADLQRQADELAAQRRTLETMRGEIMQAQQEALELRLVTEETWARLCGQHHPASVAQSVAQLRLRLAEEYRRQRSELAEQQSEIQRLAERLAEQHERWRQQRDDMQAWVVQRQQDFERQAATLVAAGRQLEAEQAAMCQERTDWQFERSRLQAEIRGLMLAPSRPMLAA